MLDYTMLWFTQALVYRAVLAHSFSHHLIGRLSVHVLYANFGEIQCRSAILWFTKTLPRSGEERRS